MQDLCTERFHNVAVVSSGSVYGNHNACDRDGDDPRRIKDGAAYQKSLPSGTHSKGRSRQQVQTRITQAPRCYEFYVNL